MEKTEDGCGDADVPPTFATTTASAAITATTAASTATPTQALEAAYVEPESTAQLVVVEPVILSCDGGPGPVLTYWPDGTVTGSTPYCEEVAEHSRQAERDHNGGKRKSPTISPTPTNGINDSYGQTPNGPGLERVEFICGYNVLCDNAGTVIPSPSLQGLVLLGNGQTCAGNGCTRP